GLNFASCDWFNDECVCADATSLVLLERLKFSNREEYRNMGGFARILDALADFQTAVAWHIYVEHNQFGLRLADFFESCRAVIDGDYLVTRISEDFAAHVLGSHTVVSEQDFASQGLVLR